jgi:threonine dehydratase
MMPPHQPVPLEEILEAQRRLRPAVLRTPLVRLDEVNGAEIYLKLENLQPTGSFKLRCAGNDILSLDPSELKQGVWTASAGNMALGVAWFARELGVPCTLLVPQDAPPAKLNAIAALGGRIIKIPFAEYQQVQIEHHYPGIQGILIHPFGDPAVMAGSATIALEILEDLPEVDIVLAPFGGGGLSCGIASALKNLKPDTKVYACEVETATPLAASLAAGSPQRVTYTPSFISGIGAPFVFPEMWSLAQSLLAGSLVVSLAQVRAAIRTLIEKVHIVVEGAGAVATAAALTGQPGPGKIACIVSGGNIDHTVLCSILNEEMTRGET